MEPDQSDLSLAFQYHRARDWLRAEECYRRVLLRAPSDAELYNNLGNVLLAQHKIEESTWALQNAIRLRPDFVEALYNLGNVYHRSGNARLAIAAYEEAIANQPSFSMAHLNLGNVLQSLENWEAAANAYLRAIAIREDYFEAIYNLGIVRQQQGWLDQAAQAYRRVIELRPELTSAFNNLGCVLSAQGDYAEAASAFRQALEQQPNALDAMLNLGSAFHSLGDHDAALAIFRKAYPLDPPAVTPALVLAMQHVCDWENLEPLSIEVIASVERDDEVAQTLSPTLVPFLFIGLPVATTPEQQLRCARRWSRRFREPSTPYYQRIPRDRCQATSRRLKIGYLSADYCTHAVAFMIAELLEKHDRDHFEIVGYSIGPDDQSRIRQRIVTAFDRFRDLRHLSFSEAAQAIAEDRIDILIDLQGHTRNARTEILACRPAPIQVNYLGYPATMGANFIDYILVDEFVVPRDQQPFFSEQLIHLPGCYQVNDGQPEISSHKPTRAECGLPEKALVFCSFNSSFKVTPRIFDIWLRLLNEVPDSVLWISESNRSATRVWIDRAAAYGIASERIVIAPQISLPEHFARHPLADLCLDTFPYNGHATASIALRTGVPLVTLAGQSMASRVAGSLLQAVGLPEWIASSFEEYEALAMRLAQDRNQLASVRARLASQLQRSSLFSGQAFARKVEDAYRSMWKAFEPLSD